MGRAFVDGSGWRGLGASWYNTVRFETRGGRAGGRNIPINFAHPITNISLLNLLTAINQHAQPRETIVIVCHGNPNGFGFRLAPGGGTNAGATRQALIDLMNTDISSSQFGVGGVSTQEVDQLRTQMAAIRGKNLTGIEIRACNMGSSPLLASGQNTLGAIREFFGSQYVAAPQTTDFFGQVAAINPRTRDQLGSLSGLHIRRFIPPQSGVSVSTTTQPDLCIRFQDRGGSSYNVGVYSVPNLAPRTRWMRTHFAFGNAFQPPQNWLTGGFVLHGVVLSDGQLYFPAESAYTNNITEFPSAL